MPTRDLGLPRFEMLLNEGIGLDPASVGRDEVRRAIRARMKTALIEDPDEYDRRVVDDETEREQLFELLLIPETWFFREPGAFALLRERAAAVRERSQTPFRALSVPCSTGEEPYSIAISLLEIGLSADAVQIDAVDVSRTALEAARRAVYGARAVRSLDAGLRGRHFTDAGDGRWKVREDATRMVRFRHGNLVNPRLLERHVGYDIVFCRNVLIYLSLPSREIVLATMSRLVADDGLLLTGHAEGQRVVAPRFVFAGHKGTFAYRKATATRVPAANPSAPVHRVETALNSSRGRTRTIAARQGFGSGDAGEHPDEADKRLDEADKRPDGATEGSRGSARTSSDRSASSSHRSARTSSSHRSASSSDRSARTSVLANADPNAGLLAVAQLADAGRLSEATSRCLEFLATHPASAPAHYLLGVIALGGRRHEDAEKAFRRAVYLNPGHEEALLQLALERARAGDEREARHLRRRAGLVRGRKRPEADRT